MYYGPHTYPFRLRFTPAGILDYISTQTQSKTWKRKTELLIPQECANQFNIEILAIWVVFRQLIKTIIESKAELIEISLIQFVRVHT